MADTKQRKRREDIAGALRGESAGEIAASVEAGVRAGRLKPGDALPTVRGLAGSLGVSPTTVAGAYRILRERGLLLTAGRRGTRIAPAPPVQASIASAAPEVPEGSVDLATGNPDPALLPRLGPFLAALASVDPEPHLYADEIHAPDLLTLARQRLRADRLPAAALGVVSGALDGIERVLLARLRPGDRVAVEDPGFPGVLHLVRALGLEIVPVPVDDAGPLPDGLDAALRGGARALIVTPRAQNPTGAALDAARTRALRRILDEHPAVVVVEDDHCEAASGARARTVCGPGTEHWAIVRSVSKTLGPDLRLAVLAGDPETVSRVSGRQRLGSRWVSHVLQQLVVRLWRDRATQEALSEAASIYRARRGALIAALARHGIAAHGRSGLNVWVPVPEETAVVQRLAAAGYAVKAGEVFRIESPPALRVTVASLPVEDAPGFAQAFADAVGAAGAASTA